MHADRVQVKLVDQEVVGVFGLDVPVGQCFGGKVAQVECDDDLGPCPHCGGEDVSVLGVGQVEGADERFVARDDRVTNGEVHQGPGALQPGFVQVRSVGVQGPEGFIQDRLGLFRLDEPCLCEPNKDIAQRGGIQHVCVVDDDKGHSSIPMSWVSAVSSSAALPRCASSRHM